MRYSSLASVFEIPWRASKITLTVSFRNNVRSNFLSPSPLKFSRAFDWIHKKWEPSNKNPTGRENHSGSLVPWDRLWNPILWACYKEILNCKDNIRGHEMIHPCKRSRILPIPHLDIFSRVILHSCRVSLSWISSRLWKNPKPFSLIFIFRLTISSIWEFWDFFHETSVL